MSDFTMIFMGLATVEDILDLYRMGYRFGISDGRINKVITPTGRIYTYGRAQNVCKDDYR